MKPLVALLALAALFTSQAAIAKDVFVPYSQAQKELKSPAASKEAISAEELMSMKRDLRTVYVYDARSRADYQKERIEGALLPVSDDFYKQQEMFKLQILKQPPSQRGYLEKALKDIPRDAPIVTYCNRNCPLSKQLQKQLESLGFTNVRWLSGGIDVWRENGYPITKG